jgi:protein-S-isoprenylcysteine O-methyltransferase Ste14
MKALIPPPVVLLSCGALMWIVDAYLPSFRVAFPGNRILFWVLLLAGMFLIIFTIASFLRRGTTFHPGRRALAGATSLMVTGVFRYTRNPIYLGMAIMLVAWAIFLQNVLALLGPVIFIAFITRYQIKPEEEALEKVFGEDYARYKARVRRWV